MTGTRQDWIDYAREFHLFPLLRRLVEAGVKKPGDGLSLISFGCGTAEIEKAMFDRGWPISKIALREFDAKLLRGAEQLFAPAEIEKSFEFFDFNNPVSTGETYDVVFFCHSIHHAQNLESFLPYVNGLLNEHSLIVGLDHFGPVRMQTEPDVRAILERIFHALPARLRRNLAKDGEIEDRFPGFNMAELIKNDPTEGPRTSDLRTLLFSLFTIVEVLPMGGTIVAPLLAFRAGNFVTEDDLAILEMIFVLEEQLIRARAIKSDDLFFVLRRSDRL
jgi:SAM-dependent methyltransferase